MATFQLTPEQQAQIRRMSPDAAERQIAIWRKQWEDAQRAVTQSSYDRAEANRLQTVRNPPKPQAPATRPSGGGGGGGAPAPAPAPMSTAPASPYANWQDAAKELYGGYYAIIQSVPELSGLLQRAYNEKWSRDRFEYELRQTNWWKNNSDSARQWDMTSQIDPATAAQQIRDRAADMKALAMNEYGIELRQSVVEGLARNSLRMGWSQQLIAQAVGVEITRTPGALGQLAAGFLGQNLRTTAKEYGVPLSDATQQSWLVDIVSGKQTRQTFQAYVLDTAKRLFPTIASQLDSGQTFQQIVDPYRNFASQILELNPEVIDFIDPKWTKAINFSDDKGVRRTMDFDEWGDYLRQDKQFGYEYTSQAQQRAYQVVNDLANLFGKV